MASTRIIRLRNSRLRALRLSLLRFLHYLLYENLQKNTPDEDALVNEIRRMICLMKRKAWQNEYESYADYRRELEAKRFQLSKMEENRNKLIRIRDSTPLRCNICIKKYLDLLFYNYAGKWYCEFCYHERQELIKKDPYYRGPGETCPNFKIKIGGNLHVRKGRTSGKVSPWRKIRTSLRSLVIALWMKNQEDIISRFLTRFNLDDPKIVRDVALVSKFYAEMRANDELLLNSKILCRWCGRHDIDLFYNPVNKAWYCKRCYRAKRKSNRDKYPILNVH